MVANAHVVSCCPSLFAGLMYIHSSKREKIENSDISPLESASRHPKMNRSQNPIRNEIHRWAGHFDSVPGNRNSPYLDWKKHDILPSFLRLYQFSDWSPSFLLPISTRTLDVAARWSIHPRFMLEVPERACGAKGWPNWLLQIPGVFTAWAPEV